MQRSESLGVSGFMHAAIGITGCQRSESLGCYACSDRNRWVSKHAAIGITDFLCMHAAIGIAEFFINNAIGIAEAAETYCKQSCTAIEIAGSLFWHDSFRQVRPLPNMHKYVTPNPASNLECFLCEYLYMYICIYILICLHL